MSVKQLFQFSLILLITIILSTKIHISFLILLGFPVLYFKNIIIALICIVVTISSYGKFIKQNNIHEILDKKMTFEIIPIKINNNQKTGFYEIQDNNITVFVKTKKNLIPDAKLTVYGTLSYPKQSKNPGSFNSSLYYALYNADYQLAIENIISYTDHKTFKSNVSDYLTSITHEHFPMLNGFIRSSVLGDKSKFTNEQIEVIKISGLSHFFALSGLHVGFILFIIWAILSQFIQSFYSRFIILVITMIIYITITGLSPSLFRATLMASLYLCSKYLELNISNKRIFWVTLILNISFFQADIYKASFWLSYLAMFSILYGIEYIKSYYSEIYYSKRFVHRIIVVLVTLIVPYFGTMPLIAYLFGEISLIAPLSNLLILPVLVFDLYGALLFILTSFLSHTISYQIGFFLEHLNQMIFYLLYHFKDVPMLGTKTYLIEFIMIYFLIIAVIIKRNYLVFKYFKYVLITTMILLIVKMIISYQWFNIHLFDLGQAQSILITKNKQTLLYDAGKEVRMRQSKKNMLKESICALGIDSIDQIIISHNDFDHYGNLSDLTYRHIVFDTLQNKSSISDQIKWIILTDSIETTNKNDASKVTLVSLGDIKILLTGDISKIIENQLVSIYGNDLKSNILQIAHHGSNTSSSKLFIKYVNPEYSLISVGINNKYKHPSYETLSLLEKTNLIRTDRDGYTHFISNGKTIIQLYHWFHLFLIS